MEAVALYTFRATEGDELSFNKGDMLKVRVSINQSVVTSNPWRPELLFDFSLRSWALIAELTMTHNVMPTHVGARS